MRRHPWLRWTVFSVGSIVLGAVVANTSEPKITSKSDVTDEITEITAVKAENENISRLSLTLPLPEKELSAIESFESAEQVTQIAWQTLKVKSGDSLSALFDHARIKPAQLMALLDLGESVKPLLTLHPGETIQIHRDDDGRLLGLRYDTDHTQTLHIERENDQLHVVTIDHDIEARPKHAAGIIKESLFMSGQQAGISDNLIMELAGIFGWDIDFVLDIREGDRFSIVYEEIYKNGSKLKDGNILAAEFINQGKTYRAARYVDPQSQKTGYYAPDGKNLRKAFLRSPVKFSHISSKFSLKRYHPLLHKFRSHKGVDYAARRGTPVSSSGDGKIVFKGKKGGYGNVVIVKHGSRYSTLYAHLSRFAKKIYVGRRVKQGEIIGYVGSTGLATGPHLHYEFLVNGVHRNPLRVRFPSAKPISKNHLLAFREQTDPLFSQLDVIERNLLAFNQ